MSVIREAGQTKEIYAQAGKKGWVLPCFCSENLTTTEAVLSAAEDYRTSRGLTSLPVVMAITCLYEHRSQAVNYTHTKRWDTGLKLFTESIKILCENGGPFENLDVMIHLDHIQHDLDAELLAEVYVELVEARQAQLGLVAVPASKAVASLSAIALRVRPVPLPTRVSEDERAAHGALIATLGDKAIWNDYTAPAPPAST